MRANKFNGAKELEIELLKRIVDIDQRERIVIYMPFSCCVNRIEIYCSETVPKSSAYSGTPFPGIVKLSQFNDLTNKAYSETSYTYKNDLIRFVPRLCANMFKLMTKELETA